MWKCYWTFSPFPTIYSILPNTGSNLVVFLCTRIERSWAYCFTIVRPSVCMYICPSVCPSVCLVWRHISLIHISWYQGQGHLQRSRSNIRVMCLKRWVFQGHLCFRNTSCFFFCKLQMLSLWTCLKFCCLVQT